MDPQTIYWSKLTTAAGAAERIEGYEKMAMGIGLAEPRAMLKAIVKRVKGGDLGMLRLYYNEFMTPACRSTLPSDLIDISFIPMSSSQASRILAEDVGVDTLITSVSPMDENGYFTFGTNNDYGNFICRAAQKIIVEVNDQMPRVLGDSLVHVSEVDAIIECSRPLAELRPNVFNAVDKEIGRIIAHQIPDGATLHMGVGGIPDAVCAELGMHSDLGIHSEVISTGMVELIKAGVITNRRKNINRLKSVFTVALGNKKLYDYINNNAAVESRPAYYVNDPGVVVQHDHMMSVNCAAEIDLTGACNAAIFGENTYNPAGGQLDFLRGTYMSRNGKSFVCIQSTTPKGERSRITPQLLGTVTTPSTDVHYVVTEYGCVNLKGKSSSERALSLIGIAHPKFREELLYHAKAGCMV
jgi:itaconate CoA-transferase